MNERRYRIYYDNRGLPKGEIALDERHIAHEVDYLPTELRLYLSAAQVETVTTPDPEKPGVGIFVTLKGKLSDDALDNLLADCVRKVNTRTSGLCFLIDRISQ